MNKNNWLAASVAVLAMTVSSAMAAVSVKEAQRLKQDLTPFGAERAGNGKDIPPWRGGLTLPPPGYKRLGQYHIDPYANDKVLFTITAKNMKQYEQHLSEGQKALFRTYPDSFKMNVYKTRRTSAAPEWVYENTYKNALRAELDDEGNGLLNAYGGIPFPITRTAKEMMWNHLTRWQGVYSSRRTSEAAVQVNGDFSLVTSRIDVQYEYYNRKDAGNSDILFYFLVFTTAPARLAGGAVLVHETVNQIKNPRQAWGYNAGQRRVRRAPNLSYDTPIGIADGLRVADDTSMFNGAMDRYDWKLLGKKEIYIPYNSYQLTSRKITYKDLLKPYHLNPEYVRYEKHRVWVVEANLKEGQRHIYKKRRFYLDEDCWAIALADQYDQSGSLWRVSVGYSKVFYELPATWNTVTAFHDLQARRYHVQGLDNEESEVMNLTKEPPGARYFTPSELRRRGRR